MRIRLTKVINNLKTPIIIFVLAASIVTLFPPYESKNGRILVFDFFLNTSTKYYSYPETHEQVIYDDLKDCKILEKAINYRLLNAGTDTSYNYIITRNKLLDNFEISRGKIKSIRSYKNYSVTERRWSSFVGNIAVSKFILEYVLCLLFCSGYYLILKLKTK